MVYRYVNGGDRRCRVKVQVNASQESNCSLQVNKVFIFRSDYVLIMMLLIYKPLYKYFNK